MNYKMVNENLQIASVSLVDLTLEQVQEMLAQWEKGAKISSLICFIDKNDVLVLNRDNEDYQVYLSLAESYLSGDAELRKQIKKDFWNTRKEMLQVLENCCFSRIAHKNIDAAHRNTISAADGKILCTLMRECDDLEAVLIAFRLGVIKGKRVERAKRKAGDHNA